MFLKELLREYMNPEQAKDRARALLNVIETMYEIRITNLEEVIEAIIEKTLDEQKILTICTALNSWVAMNAALRGEVEIPVEVVNGLTGKIMRL
jgi:mannose/fructose/N-acetylgalactosamine-specific phosphotransferase system component IIB